MSNSLTVDVSRTPDYSITTTVYANVKPIVEKTSEWTPLSEDIPEIGEDIILAYTDDINKEIKVSSAWRCNVSDDNPNGDWCLEGKWMNHRVIHFKKGVAWRSFPKPDKTVFNLLDQKES